MIAYYYENKSIKEIAEKLEITESGVKWHLFKTKKNLKEGLTTMRANELKFNPVKFEIMGLSGSAGRIGGTAAFFRSALSQNIAYCVYRNNKTVNQIAEELGVSPVFVESEAEYLEEYGFLIKKGNKYLANIIIEGGEDADETIALQDKMYSDAAKLFATELYDKLVDSRLLEDDGIESRYSSDKNYLIWALLPYITGFGGELNEEIAFEECATRRKDGSFDIPYAILQSDTEAKYESSLKKWCGPAWISRADTILWCCRSEWSEERDMQNISQKKI